VEGVGGEEEFVEFCASCEVWRGWRKGAIKQGGWFNLVATLKPSLIGGGDGGC